MKPFLAFALLLPVLTAAAERTNILFIFSDDHAQHAVSAYGSKVNTTPHLDRLAKEGTRFANSFIPNSICTLSHATLFDQYKPMGRKTIAEAIAASAGK